MHSCYTTHQKHLKQFLKSLPKIILDSHGLIKQPKEESEATCAREGLNLLKFDIWKHGSLVTKTRLRPIFYNTSGRSSTTQSIS